MGKSSPPSSLIARIPMNSVSGPSPSSVPKPVPVPLTTLAPGGRAVVAEIRIPPQQRGRLLEMGLLVGTTLELVRFAPLGDPIEIKLRGYNLSLRKHEAEQVLVRPQ